MKPRWVAGTPELHNAVEQAMAKPEASTVEIVAASKHRRITRLDLPLLGKNVVVKEYLPASHHENLGARAIDTIRPWFGRSSAEHEWSSYEVLHANGIPVPDPLGFARLPGGGAWIVMRFIEGAAPLQQRLSGYPFEKRRRMRELGELIHELHKTGLSHSDLHVGNVLVSAKEMWLVDLQRVVPFKHTSDRVQDVSFMDFSLHHAGVSVAARLRFRIAALGLGPFRVASERELLREVGRASHRRAVDYYHGRTRRTLREGEGFARLRSREGSGMRLETVSEEAIDAMLAAHRDIVATGGPARLKCDHRSNVTRVEFGDGTAIVKEVVKTSARKRLADLFRGSPGQRAWLAGHGLRLRGIGAAQPLAYGERFDRGVPVGSWVILEDLGDAPSVASLTPEDAKEAELGKHLLDLLRRLHRAETVHGDLQAVHIHFVEGRPTLIDLESVRFLECLYDRHRIKMLCELNASVADEVLPTTKRCDLLDRYLVALPFDRGNARAVGEIVRRSLARRQRWQGVGCDLSRRFVES
ncbi:MAG: lipopolysaccharide kinase InaA family protein [Myxococcota bacterium]|jgi:tRNA A-37 threonylcarbamoyl transferase component Bud32|nr:lipopolysaccharide kinase InaA family protein [Myxococcota bacterium]